MSAVQALNEPQVLCLKYISMFCDLSHHPSVSLLLLPIVATVGTFRYEQGCIIATKHQRRPCSGQCITGSNSLRSMDRTTVVVQQAQRDRQGPSGLNVGRYSPTSPGGWDAMRQALQEAGVSA